MAGSGAALAAAQLAEVIACHAPCQPAGEPPKSRTNTAKDAKARAINGRPLIEALEAALQQRLGTAPWGDARCKQHTAVIVHDLLPAMLAVAERAAEDAKPASPAFPREVGAAALATACLLDAPANFLEALLSVPWSDVCQPRPVEDGGVQGPPSQAAVSTEERKLLVNTPIQSPLLECMLDVLFKSSYADWLPPILQLSPASEDGSRKAVTRESVAALLDGATSLHCAAVQASPTQVEHLLFCGADPLMRTSAGELALELVPVCAPAPKSAAAADTPGATCYCSGTAQRAAWECRSQLTRSLIVRKCIFHFGGGFGMWFKLVCLSVLCLLGLWGCYASLTRPPLEAQEGRRAAAKRAAARAAAQALVDRMRSQAQSGHSYLAAAKQQQYGCRATHADLDDPGDEAGEGSIPLEDLGIRDPLATSDHTQSRREPKTKTVKDAEKAFEKFVRAVHALQGLELRGGVIPQGFIDTAQSVSELTDAGPICQVLEEEQADLYCGWAESVLLKLRGCTCPGCAALAMQAIRMAHIQAARLFARVDKKKARAPEAWREVGSRLVRIIHAHVCLLLDTEARQSAMRAAVWQAQQCLQEWDKMARNGLTVEAGIHNSLQVACLEQWAKTAEADLLLVEALLGAPLQPTQQLADVLPSVVVYDVRGNAFLTREVTKDTAQQLETALAVAVGASDRLAALTRSAARNAAEELAAGEALRDIMSVKSGSGGMSNAVDALAAAIEAAARFPHLEAEARAAKALKERWEKRAEAVAQLEAVMDDVRAPGTAPVDAEQSKVFWADWGDRISRLEAAIEVAREANISVNKAKRLLKELQAQAGAAEAAMKLAEVLQRRPAGSSVLKGALAKAEAASQAAANNTSGLTVGQDLLHPTIVSARRQLEVEKAAEALHRAVSSSATVTDLPKLEAAILAARKVGAELLDPEAYRAASDQRAQLDSAARSRAALDNSLKLLQRQGRPEDAEAVERAIEEAADSGPLLAADVAKAQEQVARWRAATAAQAKLARALKDGSNTVALSRAIQEAAAAGVKVAEARRVLKLMQGLESALTQNLADGPTQYQQLKAKIEAAEQGGVPGSLVDAAKAQLQKLLLMEVKEALESALKPRFERSASQRTSVLRSALDKAELLLDFELSAELSVAAAEAGPSDSEDLDAIESPDQAAESSESASTAAEEEDEDLAAVKRMVAEARKHLAAEAAEQERIDAERAEEARLKRDRQRRERAERERTSRERSEREKSERERAEKERLERKEKERLDRLAAVREAQQAAEQLRRERTAEQWLEWQQDGQLARLDRALYRRQDAANQNALHMEMLQILNNRGGLVDNSLLNSSYSDLHSEASERLVSDLYDPVPMERSNGRLASRSTSLRSSAASNELEAGRDVGGEADTRADSAARLLARSSASSSFTADPERRLPSPDLVAGVESSGGSFGTLTPRLKYADLGGASWGMDSTTSASRPLADRAASHDARAVLPPGRSMEGWASASLGRATSEGLKSASLEPSLNASLASLGIFAQDDMGPLRSANFNPNALLTRTSDPWPSAANNSTLSSAGLLAGSAISGAGGPRKTLRVQRPCRYFLQGHCPFNDPPLPSVSAFQAATTSPSKDSDVSEASLVSSHTSSAFLRSSSPFPGVAVSWMPPTAPPAGTSLLQGLFRTVANCIGPEMTSSEPNRALCSVLDNDGEGQDLLHEESEMSTETGDKPAAQLYHEEQQLRLKAEGEALDVSRRLAVAQEQLAEYASQKAADARTMLEQAQALQEALGKVLQSRDQGDAGETGLSQLDAAMDMLRRQLQDAAGEAQNFAQQQKADVERTKRSPSQANLSDPEAGDVETKRLREDSDVMQEEDEEAEPASPVASTSRAEFGERALYIPLRLDLAERRLLRLLEAALSVSEYTDKVDIQSWRSKTARINTQIRDICAILSGLVVAQNYKEGQKLIADRSFADNAEFFQDCFEVGRRFKVMNPDKMRSEYGKLVYMLMDSAEAGVQDLLEFKCVRPLRTVHSHLAELGCTDLLADPLMEVATAEIVVGERPRHEIQRDIKKKERARETLARKYARGQVKEEDILLCLYSISDNNSFLLFNRDPIDRAIDYLKAHFRPDRVEEGYSLAISGGCAGARLTHNHERQYHYVLQSLTLWREISHDMFKLWYLAESDLLREGNSYRLTNTGQGLNRVQQAPLVSKAMHAILWRCQQKLGHWVGSSVIHLGDHNVPNALMFIDKYTQVPRILNPVVLVLDSLPKLCRDPQLRNYVDRTFGDVEACRKSILLDFFRHAFDGGGADNFFDAGSCIDGRLTSAWNWGSKIEKKPYYHIFRIAGFVGFDGDFQK
ncbi:hypothetical protein WJX72_000489 [[Myrmecia] bisecta]|uniref:C3H1-type domain-containing protein n=1 Tax=[Myrmecia] bisecta TaxID=41462 RepID=A0AAW1Q6D8_9CHLO